MKRVFVLAAANVALAALVLVLVILGFLRKQPVEIVKTYDLAPTVGYARQISESFVTGLETVNPANVERQEQVLSLAGGELYHKLVEVLVKRKEIIKGVDSAQFVKISNSACKREGSVFHCKVEGEKAIAFGEGVSYRASVSYKLTWLSSAPTLANPVGMTLTEFDVEENYAKHK